MLMIVDSRQKIQLSVKNISSLVFNQTQNKTAIAWKMPSLRSKKFHELQLIFVPDQIVVIIIVFISNKQIKIFKNNFDFTHQLHLKKNCMHN